MSDFTDLLRFLIEVGAAAIPWILTALGIWACISFSPDIKSWLKSRSESERKRAERAAEQNEILRNNNAVIENCTQTMKMIENYMKGQNQEVLAAINEVIAGIDKHESMSAEREQHLQTVLNKNSTEIGKVRGDVGILLDRD